jgi:hypothetical protein
MELNIPGAYLKKEDLPKGEDLILTIAGGQMEEIGQEKDSLPVLSFEETEQKLVLNKTNIALIFAAHNATDTDELMGKKIALFNDKSVSFGGKVVGGIRVRPHNPDDEPPF